MSAYEDAVARLSASARRYELALSELRGADADLSEAIEVCRRESKHLVNGHAREREARDTNDWTPTEDVIAVVWANARTLAGEFRVRDLQELTPYATETVRRALILLREREMVRVVSIHGRSPVYALMPEYVDG